MEPDIDYLLATYPRRRPPLPPAYQEIYEREYLLNRKGGSRAARLAKRAEGWMHRTIAKNAISGSVLEIGAGTLNHLDYEPGAFPYDVIEPFREFYVGNPSLRRVRTVFGEIGQVPPSNRYDRIISIAVLEHLEHLPSVLATSALLLGEGGRVQHAIPSEGGTLWGLGWRLTTGLGYWLRNRLSYGVAMRHEHINDASEIVALVQWFFEKVEVSRFPASFHHASLYTYMEAAAPRRSRCRDYLSTVGG